MHTSRFSDLPLSPEMLQNLESLNYLEMTAIQSKGLPAVLNNQDVIAQAATGSGKTAAFGIGLIVKTDPELRQPQSLVICPTRELAEQIAKEIRRLARFTPNIRVLVLCGGKPVRSQVESLNNGAHIIVGTPGRLQDHILKKTLPLKKITTLILDEADRMLDMGFYEDMMKIIKSLPENRQTCLFSATYLDNIQKISRQIQNNPLKILSDADESSPDITQITYAVEPPKKTALLKQLLSDLAPQSVIVFCKTKIQCDEASSELNQAGQHALALHGDLDQRERDEVLLQFAHRSCSILVATDVASRGLDIQDVDLVVNYELPRSPEVYVHRIGRTGRAGKSGKAVSFASSSDSFVIQNIENLTQTRIQRESPPSHRQTKQLKFTPPTMCTFSINAGKRDKIRPGDIVGALTSDTTVNGTQIGKIDVSDRYAYVSVERTVGHHVMAMRQTFKIKGRAFKIRPLHKF